MVKRKKSQLIIAFSVILLTSVIVYFNRGFLFKADTVITPGESQVLNLTNNGADYEGSSVNSPQIPKYEKFELTFDVNWYHNREFSNPAQKYDPITDGTINPYWPYDPNPAANTQENIDSRGDGTMPVEPGKGISIDGIFTSPTGEKIVQPGFYYQDYEYEQKTKAEDGSKYDWYYPKGSPVWKIRFTPQNSGDWQFEIRVVEASGTTTYIPAQNTFAMTTETLSNQNHGFAKVSSNDTRYFEGSDGTYLNLIGRSADSYDTYSHYTQLKELGVNFIRPWWQGSQGPVLFGLSGQGGAHGWGDHRLIITGEEHRDNRLFSGKLTGSASGASAYNNTVIVKPSTNYVMSAWVKTVNLNGSGEYGVTLGGSPYQNLTCTQNCLLKGDNDWTEVKYSFTTKADQESFGWPSVSISGNTTGNAYFSDLSIKEDLGNGILSPELTWRSNLDAEQDYSQLESYKADYMVSTAKANDIYLKIVLEEKQDILFGNILKNGKGGSIQEYSGNLYDNVFASETHASRTYQQYYWRYIIARYGFATNIHSFEFNNEADPNSTSHQNAVIAMANYFNTNDPSKHLVTSSNYSEFPVALWSNQTVGYSDLHMYIGNNRIWAGWDGPWHGAYNIPSTLGTGFSFDSTTAKSGQNSLKFTFPSRPNHDQVKVYSPDGANFTYSKSISSRGSENGKLTGPTSAKLDSSGNIFIADSDNYRIQKFDSSGNYLLKWGSEKANQCGNNNFNSLNQIDIDSNNNVYSISWCSGVQKFDSSGNFIKSWNGDGASDNFGSAVGMAIDGNYLYLTDTSKQRVWKYDLEGNVIKKWGTNGTENGQFKYPVDITFDSNYLYVLDRDANLINKFTKDGEFVSKWSVGEGGWAIGINGGNIYIAKQNGEYAVEKYSTDGTLLGSYIKFGNQIENVSIPRDITFDALGNMYISDFWTPSSTNSNLETQLGVKEGHQIQLTASVKADNYAKGRIRDSGVCLYYTPTAGMWSGWPDPSCLAIPEGTYDWKEVNITFTVPTNTTSDLIKDNNILDANIRLYPNDADSQGYAWLDDLVIKDTTDNRVLNFNGGFEYIKPMVDDVVAAHQSFGQVTRSYDFGKPTVRGEFDLLAPVRFATTIQDPYSSKKWGTSGQEQFMVFDKDGIWWKKTVWSGIDSSGLIEMHWSTGGDYVKDRNFTYGKSYQNFMKNIDLSNGKYTDVSAQTSTANLRVLGQKEASDGKANKAHLWIDNKNYTWKAAAQHNFNLNTITWSASDTYASTSVTYYNSHYYKSLQNNNTNHALSDGAWWQEISQAEFLTLLDMPSLNPPLPAPISGNVTVPSMKEGWYKVEWWDTTNGSVTSTDVKQVGSDGNLVLTVNNLASDVAVKIYSSAAKPSISIESPANGAVVLDSSVTVTYTVDGERKTKTFSDLKVGDNQLDITEGNKSDSSVTSTASIKVVRKESFTLSKDSYATGWNMVSFPLLGGGIISRYLPPSFVVRRYDQASNSYDKLEGTDTSLTSGLGYWVKIDDVNKLDNFKYELGNASSVSVPVGKGWNFLGNPFDSNLPLSNLIVKYKDGGTVSYEEAVRRKDVSGYVWSYESKADPKQYYFVAIEPDKYRTSAHKETFISPFRGFWMIVKSDGIGEIIMNK